MDLGFFFSRFLSLLSKPIYRHYVALPASRHTGIVPASTNHTSIITPAASRHTGITPDADAMAAITSATTHVADFTRTAHLAYKEAQSISQTITCAPSLNVIQASTLALEITKKALAALIASIEASHYLRYAEAKARGGADSVVASAKENEAKAKRAALKSYKLAQGAIDTANALIINPTFDGTHDRGKARKNLEEALNQLKEAKKAADQDEISEKLAASFLSEATDTELAAFLSAMDHTARTDVILGVYTRLETPH